MSLYAGWFLLSLFAGFVIGSENKSIRMGFSIEEGS